MRTIRILVLAAATIGVTVMAAPALAGGGGGGGGGPCPAFASGTTSEIVLEDFCIAPISATATPGATLTVRNAGAQPHTLTAVDGTFDTGVLQSGETATIELPADGSAVPVYCTLHADTEGNGMAGIIHLDLATEAMAPAAADVASSGNGSGLALVALLGGIVAGAAGSLLLRRRITGQSHETTSA